MYYTHSYGEIRKSAILLYILFVITSTWASGFYLSWHFLSWEIYVLLTITHSLVNWSKNTEGLSILLGGEGRDGKEEMSTQYSFKVGTVSNTVAQDLNIPGLMCASADEEPAPPSGIIHLGHCPANTRCWPNVDLKLGQRRRVGIGTRASHVVLTFILRPVLRVRGRFQVLDDRTRLESDVEDQELTGPYYGYLGLCWDDAGPTSETLHRHFPPIFDVWFLHARHVIVYRGLLLRDTKT